MSEQQKDKATNAQDVQNAAAKEAVLKGRRAGILGIKSGMTQVFDEKTGDVIPVTVIDLQPTVITQVKTKDRDGYEAVQVGIKPKIQQRTNRADRGHFKKSGAPGFYNVCEFRVDSVEGLNPGLTVSSTFVKEGELVDVTGESKGKGFQGVMKRYHFAGGPKTHGASVVHRMGGSIGMRATPGKVYKGRKMSGHMGAEKVTTQNLKVVRVDMKNNLMLIKGSVPGPKHGLVTVCSSIKGRA